MQGLIVLLPTLVFAIFAAALVWFETHYRSRNQNNVNNQSTQTDSISNK